MLSSGSELEEVSNADVEMALDGFCGAIDIAVDTSFTRRYKLNRVYIHKNERSYSY